MVVVAEKTKNEVFLVNPNVDFESHWDVPNSLYSLSQATGKQYVLQTRHGALCYNHNGNLMIFCCYAGPEDGVFPTALECIKHANENGCEHLFLLSETHTKKIASLNYQVSQCGWWQDVVDLQNFSIDNKSKAMRKLRYMVNRYQKEGDVKTIEVDPNNMGEDYGRVMQVVDDWMETKRSAADFMTRFKKSVVDKNIADKYRFFLTYRNNHLDNFVVVTKVNKNKGAILDLEFFSKESKLGNLDYAIIKIMEKFKEEGHAYFSLGLTLGTSYIDTDVSEGRLYRVLRKFHRMGALNADGNYQFKNKFGTENEPFNFCTPQDISMKSLMTIPKIIANPF